MNVLVGFRHVFVEQNLHHVSRDLEVLQYGDRMPRVAVGGAAVSVDLQIRLATAGVLNAHVVVFERSIRRKVAK
ncbi:hypothetical protein D9M68_617620 [compost metagenome]